METRNVRVSARAVILSQLVGAVRWSRCAQLAMPLLLTTLLVGCGTALSGSVARFTNAQPEPAIGFALDPSDGSLLMAKDGLFRSRDDGKSWQPLPVGASAGRIQQVVVAPAAPFDMFAAGPGTGVLRSTDHGQSWSAITQELESSNVTVLAVHSYIPQMVYAWVAGRGIFRTPDAGEHWYRMDDGPDVPVSSLVHSTLEGSMNTGWLYAGTPDGPYLSMDCF